MLRRPLLKIVIAALIAFVAATASAAPRDAAANKKIDEAINTHYLATEFDKAEAVLTGTINACGDKCSPGVIAKAWMYVGIVRGSGKNDMKGAKEAFGKAIAADPKVALDDALATPDTKKAFAEVQGGGAAGNGGEGGKGGEAGNGGEGGKPKKPPKGEDAAGEMECQPKVTEVQTRRPIPMSCTTDEEAARAELRYKEFGGDNWKSIKMSKKGDAFQAEIPCSATQLAGTLKFYVRALDASGEAVDTYGSKGKPVEINVNATTDQEPPAFPDKDPPARCAEAVECPPDFPGCHKAGGGTKGWGSSCASNDECQSGLACVNGTCDNAASCDVDADCSSGAKCVSGKCESGGGPSGPFKKNWLGVNAAYDLAIVGGSDVCSKDSQDNKGFACFAKGTDQQYVGNPQPGRADKISTGVAPATARVMVSFDRVLSSNITLGARLGYAFNGGPAAGKNKDVKFLPYHAEIRLEYWLGQNVFAKKGLRPYVGVGGGVAQVDAKLPVTVINCGAAATCPTNNTPTELDAYKKLGQSFVGLNGGAMYATSPNGGFLLNLNVMFMLPTSGQVLEPSIGYVFGI